MKTIIKMSLFTIIPFISISLIIIAQEKPLLDPLWEMIPTPNSSANIIRMPVPHGWLVAYRNGARGLVYIPDDKHEWKFND